MNVLDAKFPNFFTQKNEIEDWFKVKWSINKVPFYGSLDLRNSGFKITNVDMNLFPGGFNNLHENNISLAIDKVKQFLAANNNTYSKILLIPENHTKNLSYLQNVYALYRILVLSGLEVRIGGVSEELTVPTEMITLKNDLMIYHPLEKSRNIIATDDGFIPDLILLNNDLSGGYPQILENILQKVLPPLHAGWYRRKKSNHFKEYSKVTKEFAEDFDFDPWLIDAYFEEVENLDFANKSGLELLAAKVQIVLAKTKYKYQEYGIKDEPYTIVKANNGTYGMGIMAVKSPDEIINMNRKSRNKMAVIKDGQNVSDVIVQEGVKTIETVDGGFAEMVAYMIHDQVIGSFYRVHQSKGVESNLNSVGATFVPHDFTLDEKGFYPYNVIARLSLLAASQELAKYI